MLYFCIFILFRYTFCSKVLNNRICQSMCPYVHPSIIFFLRNYIHFVAILYEVGLLKDEKIQNTKWPFFTKNHKKVGIFFEPVHPIFLKLGSQVERGQASEMFQADFLIKPLIPLIPLNPLKNQVFPLFFRLVHQNCPIFGTNVNLDNTYLLAMF